MKIAVLGAGNIADKVARTLEVMPEVECYAVAAREKQRAEAFAQRHGFEKAYGSYKEMLADEAVELVYIATPHSHHAAHMRLCIAHKKPILCEKALTANAREAEAVLREAREAGVFCAEAIWTRYMPSRKLIEEVIESGVVGRITALSANLFYPVWERPRLTAPALCGGALLDMGIYPLNFAVMCFGTGIERIDTSCTFTPSGVDAMNTVTLFYEDGRMAVLASGMYARSDRQGILYGEKGYILVENINDPVRIRCYDTEDRLIRTVDCPPEISGYEYEFSECIRAVEQGLLEPPSMPHADSVFMMSLMDRCRKKWGLVYEADKEV